MNGDLNTKPLQGELWRKFMGRAQNCSPDLPPDAIHTIPACPPPSPGSLQECVGDTAMKKVSWADVVAGKRADSRNGLGSSSTGEPPTRSQQSVSSVMVSRRRDAEGRALVSSSSSRLISRQGHGPGAVGTCTGAERKHDAHGRGKRGRGEDEGCRRTAIAVSEETHRSVVKGTSEMSLEYAGKRQRVDGDGFAGAVDPAKTSATSSADLESMMKQALGRIDSLERRHEEMKTSMGRENRALREGICRLTEDNKASQASMERQIEDLRDDIETLKSKNKALKWSLERLASKVQEDWEYPVAIQPDEYWQNKGYEDEAIEYLKEGFFEELKEAVSQLEHGVCEIVTVCFVHHDEDLMPHWNVLFRSFEHINPYGEGVALYLRSIELNEEMMRQICNHIRYRNISRVEFRDNAFANMRDAISELGKSLKSRKLKSLEWLQNRIESTEDMNLFTRVLTHSNAVDKLTFTSNGNGNAQALLAGVDFSRYKVLNLFGNDLRTNGQTDISDLIAINSPLEELDLYYNRL
ncbi:hypothetical protein THAOC_29804, partial [Thalassiosira oceanica]